MPSKTAMTLSMSIATPTSLPDGSVIIGIDPGLACTGIGVIRRGVASSSYLEHKVIRTDTSMVLAQRLAIIMTGVRAACLQHNPVMAAIERTFVNNNFASSLALAQARGAALAALGEAGLLVTELAPNTIKRQLTGNSLASKAKVALMVCGQLDLDLDTKLPSDATDALALALSCTPKRQRLRLTTRRRQRRR